MKIYFPKDHYNPKYRGRLFPLLKPFIKSFDFTDKERIEIYGISERDYMFVDSIIDADVVLLTMAWNYYLKFHKTRLALELIKKSKKSNKMVWVVMLDDFGLRIPKKDNCLVFRSSGYASKVAKNHMAMPVFISDPLMIYFDKTEIIEREYNELPTVGFCGLANNKKLHVLTELAKILFRNLKFKLGFSYVESEWLLSPSFFRAKLLELLNRSEKITSNFIIRDQYRAGVKNKSLKDPTRLEFFNNIKDSDYVLCVRGAGNFSVRFYETLAMGRIPVFINTDCILPLPEIIDWREHVVWVEYDEIKNIENIIMSFHQKLNKEKMNNLFKKNRQLWEDKLKMNSFFNNYKNEF